MTTVKKKSYDRGIRAESLAALWLQFKNYQILERRYKTPVGEIDLIVRKDDLIAFVEVKARMTNAQALESVTPTMQKRIAQAAKHYISHNKCDNMDMRFDLITVRPPFFMQHLDNAWGLAA